MATLLSGDRFVWTCASSGRSRACRSVIRPSWPLGAPPARRNSSATYYGGEASCASRCRPAAERTVDAVHGHTDSNVPRTALDQASTGDQPQLMPDPVERRKREIELLVGVSGGDDRAQP